MDYDQRTKQSATVELKSTSFAAPLCMYASHPIGELNIEEFLELGWRRRTLLERVQEIALTDDAETDSSIREEQVKRKLREALKTARLQTAKDDINSHFIMRMAQCSNETHRQVFLRQECLLFKYKCRYLATNTELTKLLNTTNMSFEALTLNEVPPFVLRYLSSLTRGWNGVVFRLPFEQPAYELVHHREKVVAHGGYIYVRDRDIADLVVGQFRMELSRGVALLARKMQQITQGNPELQGMLKSLQQSDGGQYKTTQASGVVTLDKVPALAEQSFPLCMSYMYEQGRKMSHLKHNARLQFGLFLKGIGLPLDAALLFWRQLFSKKFTPDKFDKDYAYNIRHTYGAEGKRQDLTPLGCMKIIQTTPGQGEFHGCPFSHVKSKDKLKFLLDRRMEHVVPEASVRNAAVAETVSLAEAGHYQLACGRMFRAMHAGCNMETGIRHPNEYFDLSRQFHNKDVKEEEKKQ